MKYFSNFKSFGSRKFLLLIIFIFNSFSIFSQTSKGLFDFKPIDSTKFIASYSLNYKWDSLNLDRVSNQEMWLFLGKNISLFVSKSNYIDMQTISKFKTLVELRLWHDNYGPYSPRFLYHIYKNHPKGKITLTEKNINGYLKYEEKLDAFNWELTQDTATIGGYLSQKAYCDYGGRKWTAWFCADIPFKDGPYKFNGLPGLIIKIYDSREHYVFELTGIEIADSDLMIEFNEYPYIKTTRQKFLRAREASRNSIANLIKQKGGDESAQQIAAKREASRNNHIELK